MTPRATPTADVPPRSTRRRAAHLAQSLFRFAPLFYLLVSLPTVVSFSTLIPPFQAPDETNHFRRAVQILRGQIVGQVASDVEAGGMLPKSVAMVAESFSFLIGNPASKLAPEIIQATRAIPWNWSEREFNSFVNTVIYPPIHYGPAILGLAIGRGLRWSVLDSYGLARYLTGITAVLIAALAIRISVQGRALFFALLSLPMSLYLFASLTQDALLIATTALAFSFYSRASGLGREMEPYERFLAAALLGAAIAARPPYIFLAVILLMNGADTSPRVKTPRQRLEKLLPLALALSIAAGWLVFGAMPVKVPFRVDEGVSTSQQIAYLLNHPGAVPQIFLDTMQGSFTPHFKQFLGILGWSDTWLPGPFYPLHIAALMVAALISMSGSRASLRAPQGLLLLAAAAVTWAAIYGTLYLTWTKVGAGTVDGVQGRYFLAPSMSLAVAIPALATVVPPPDAGSSPWRGGLEAAGWIILLSIVLASDLALPHAILLRYYG